MRKDKQGPVMRRFEGERPAPSLLAGLALFALLVLVAASCGGTAGEQRGEKESQAGAEKTQSGTDKEQAVADLEDPSLGSENAPVVMVEYADYQ